MDAKVARERMKVFTPKKIATAEAELENIFQQIGRTADNGTSFIDHGFRWEENVQKLRDLGYRIEFRPHHLLCISWHESIEN